jgi:hypothetical protein
MRHPGMVALLAASLGALLAAGGCSSLATLPAQAGQPPIVGDWQRDDAHSDDFDNKLAMLLKERQQRLRARRGMGSSDSRRGGGEQGEGGRDPREFDRLELPQEESERFRSRMVEDLRPPQLLHISNEAGGEAIDMTHDADTTGRRYQPGQTVSRIDDSGAAQINCGWNQRAFEIRAQYVHRATRHWRYEVEPGSGMLLVQFEVTDPEIGHLILASRYRRQAP